jgi:spore coat protein U-like protein
MRKLVLKALAAALTLASVAPALQAATTTNNFNVTVTLTSQCQVTNDATQTVDFGTYIAFQATAHAQNTSATLNFRCTRGFAPTSTAFDTVNGTSTGVGVLQGLQYTLTNTPVAVSGGTAASTTTIGTGDVRAYTITGSMPADQAGACATASCGPTTHVRQLIVTF